MSTSMLVSFENWPPSILHLNIYLPFLMRPVYGNGAPPYASQLANGGIAPRKTGGPTMAGALRSNKPAMLSSLEREQISSSGGHSLAVGNGSSTSYGTKANAGSFQSRRMG